MNISSIVGYWTDDCRLENFYISPNLILWTTTLCGNFRLGTFVDKIISFRNFCFKLGSASSSVAPLQWGVPQGSTVFIVSPATGYDFSENTIFNFIYMLTFASFIYLSITLISPQLDSCLFVLANSIHMPSPLPSPASSDITCAAKSDDHWRGSQNSLCIKGTDRRTTDRKSSGQRQRTALLARPTNQPCVLCGKIFRHRGNLLKHVKLHSDSPEHLCGVCKQRFESSDSLSDHLRSHMETVSGGGGTCRVCGKMFQNMETHMRSHTGVKPFSCVLCQKSFPRSGALRQHLKIHEHVLYCRVCGDSFHSQGFLRKHAQMHCRESKSMCGICGQQLDSPDVLLTHLQSHRETGGTCGVCGKTFQNMETHMRSHTGLKPYHCLVCGKHFPRPGALRRLQKQRALKGSSSLTQDCLF
uniref:C2H2-type domain-containing protein n=1 Tax=Astatotilapia calliptera TaxID=8154 RepID=A0AAX7VNR1_ASTCA